MKKIALLIVFPAIFAFSSSAIAQNMKGDMGVGLGVAYGFDLEEMGVNVNFNYSFTNEIRSAVDFTYYLAESEFTIWEANLNAHYMLVNDQALRLYALAGVQYYKFEFEFEFFGAKIAAEDDGIGFNIGAGVEYDLGGVVLFAEPKFTVSGLEQLNLTAGIRFNF